MSTADDVMIRYADELRGFGPSLPDDLAGEPAPWSDG